LPRPYGSAGSLVENDESPVYVPESLPVGWAPAKLSLAGATALTVIVAVAVFDVNGPSLMV